MVRILPMVVPPALFSSAFTEDPLVGPVTESEADVDCARVTHFGRWIDADDDSHNTRQEVLAAESLVPVTPGESGDTTERLWVGPYAGHLVSGQARLGPIGRRKW